MKYKSKIHQKIAARQQKSEKDLLLSHWISRSIERLSFIRLIVSQQQIYGHCSFSEDTLAHKVGVNVRNIRRWKKQLKEVGLLGISIPLKHDNSFKNFTSKIKSLFNIKFFLSEYVLQRESNLKTKLLLSLSLCVNTPISPQGVKGVSKDIKKIDKISYLHDLGRKERWHYKDQTLKLLAYPISYIEYAYEQLNIARYQERCCIRKTFDYLRKIMDTKMKQDNRVPFWFKYYKYLGVSVKPIATDTEAQPSYTAQAPKQERERSMTTVPAKVQPDLRYVVVNYAKRIWTELYKTNKPAFIIKRDIESRYRDYPQGQQEFNNWIKSEGKEFYEWYNENKAQ